MLYGLALSPVLVIQKAAVNACGSNDDWRSVALLGVLTKHTPGDELRVSLILEVFPDAYTCGSL